MDLLSVLVELIWFLVGQYWFLAAQNTDYSVLQDFCEI